MNIGDASEKTGLPAKTIRYYEDIGLIIADRQPNGYRDYSAEHIERLSFLKRAREFGFPIEDCRKLLGLYCDEQRHTSEVKGLAAHHLEELQLKAQEIQGLVETLRGLVEACSGQDDDDCPIIAELAAKPADTNS
ncbi:MAG: MerR family transcriptional regulator [Filomicrobium sp.]